MHFLRVMRPARRSGITGFLLRQTLTVTIADIDITDINCVMVPEENA